MIARIAMKIKIKDKVELKDINLITPYENNPRRKRYIEKTS